MRQNILNWNCFLECFQAVIALVPFQEIDVYAKESGYVKELLVDYGSRVQKGQLMAVLEIPEFRARPSTALSALASRSPLAVPSHSPTPWHRHRSPGRALVL